jgi:hypothetical protein
MVASRRKKKLRRLRDFLKRVAPLVVPPIYNAYMWLVYHTSKKTYFKVPEVLAMADHGQNILCAVWHQDGFISPFCFKGYDIVTMVAESDLGNVLAQIMRKCHYIPIRGGSGRRGREALAEIVEYINSHTGVLCGIAVDGSRGPARKVQIGIALMAQETGAPIYPLRSWAKRRILAPSWDRMLIPLPFNHLIFAMGEPLRVPPDADREALNATCLDIERRLNGLVERNERFLSTGIWETNGDRRV